MKLYTDHYYLPPTAPQPPVTPREEMLENINKAMNYQDSRDLAVKHPLQQRIKELERENERLNISLKLMSGLAMVFLVIIVILTQFL